MKFGRTYLIQILTPQNELIEIAPPFSVEFEVQRNALASVNSASLTIYNLGPRTRGLIYKDRYETVEYWQLLIWAGYDTLSKVFQGNIYEGQSFKQGPDWHTKIDAFDGLQAVQNGYTNTTVAANTPRLDILGGVIQDMPNLIQGIMGAPALAEASSRGQTLMGQSAAILNEQTDGNYFIDNEIANVLDRDEIIGDTFLLLDSEQLLVTPKRRETFIDVEILFTPEAQIGHGAEVRSRDAIYDGQYKIVGFSHSVQILGSAGGLAKTQFALDAGARGLLEVT